MSRKHTRLLGVAVALVASTALTLPVQPAAAAALVTAWQLDVYDTGSGFTYSKPRPVDPGDTAIRDWNCESSSQTTTVSESYVVDTIVIDCLPLNAELEVVEEVCIPDAHATIHSFVPGDWVNVSTTCTNSAASCTATALNPFPVPFSGACDAYGAPGLTPMKCVVTAGRTVYIGPPPSTTHSCTNSRVTLP